MSTIHESAINFAEAEARLLAFIAKHNGVSIEIDARRLNDIVQAAQAGDPLTKPAPRTLLSQLQADLNERELSELLHTTLEEMK